MKIGFVSIYPWRPCVEQTWFLAKQVEDAGHEVFFLVCDADHDICYAKILHDDRSVKECLKCIAGGIRSYTSSNIASIGQYSSISDMKEIYLKDEVFESWLSSNAATLGRYESPNDFYSSEFNHLVSLLIPTVRKTYAASYKWIKDNQLDAVCVFNGRIDITRSVFEAARSHNIPVSTYERSWFGDGLKILPEETSLGLKSIWKMVDDWKDCPLSHRQALVAASYIARRVLRENNSEWRVYNASSSKIEWPIQCQGIRTLVLPSSSNEIYGHEDWHSEWDSPLHAIDSALRVLNIDHKNTVIRCHPNWAQNFGKRPGERIEKYYSDWAIQNGIYTIPSANMASTWDLIKQSDVVIVSHSSSALEAALIGKIVVALNPSPYYRAGFTYNHIHPNDTSALKMLVSCEFTINEKEIMRKALRFLYCMGKRLPQFTDQVKSHDSINFSYLQGGQPDKLMKILLDSRIEPDDKEFNKNGIDAEDQVLEDIFNERWEFLARSSNKVDYRMVKLDDRIKRRGIFQALDAVRKMFKVGDR